MPLAAARAALLVLAVAGAEGFGSVPSGSPRRVSVERTTAAQRADLITATRRLKQTPSPWARGLDASGRRVPRRWHNLTWYDTFVVIHLTNYVENSFAHMGPAFPSWHRLMIDLLEDALNEVLPEPERTAGRMSLLDTLSAARGARGAGAMHDRRAGSPRSRWRTPRRLPLCRPDRCDRVAKRPVAQ